MNLVSKLNPMRWLRKSEAISHPAQLVELMNTVSRGFRTTIAGTKVSPATVLNIAAVYACVRIICESLGMVPLSIYERIGKGRKEAEQHPLFRLLTLAPNGLQTPMEFIEMLVAHLLLRGNMYCFKVFTKNPLSDAVVLRELIPIHPDRVEVRVTDDLRLEYWVVPIKGGAAVKIPSELIFHLRGLTLNGFTGIDVLSACVDVFGNALAQQEHNSRMFKNGVRLSGVLSHPSELDDEAYERIKKSWNDAHSGLENSFKAAILEEGMTWKEISMTAEQAQMIESMKLSIVQICGIFRVQPHKIMFLEKGASNASIEQQNISFIQDTIQPWATRIEQRINKDLIVAPQKYYVKFSLQALARGDMAARQAFYASGIQNGWMNRNEARAFEDMNPGPAALDEFLEPLNMAPAAHQALVREQELENLKNPPPAPAAPGKPGGVGTTAGSGDQPRDKPTSKKPPSKDD